MTRLPEDKVAASKVESAVRYPSPSGITLAGQAKRGVHLAARWVMLGRKIISISAAQVSTTAITSMLGFVYWWAAARFFTPEAMGLGAATTSAMLLLGTLSVSGLGTVLIKELPRHPQQRGSLILSSGLLVAVLASAFGLALAQAAPLFSSTLRPLAANWGIAVLFAAGVSLTAAAILVDQAVLGLLRERLQVVRNTVFAATKLAALAGLAIWVLHRSDAVEMGMYGIYTSWLFGNVISLLVVFLVAHGKPSSGWWHRPDWPLLRSVLPSAIAHHMLNLAFLASSLLLPVVVAWLLPTAANAYFYTAWMLAGFVGTIPFTLTVSLYAVNSADPGAFAQKMRFTLSLAFLVATLANVVLFIGAHPILSLFGPLYATNGTWSLRIFGLAVFPLIVKDHYLAIQRIQGRVGRTVPLMVVGGVLEVGGATIGAMLGGLQGLSIAWLIAVSLEALVMAPAVYHASIASDVPRHEPANVHTQGKRSWNSGDTTCQAEQANRREHNHWPLHPVDHVS